MFRKLWVFDLDNTLHDASHAIFPAISVNMNDFIARRAGKNGQPMTLEDADKLRRSYWKQYGATILGMIHHHNVEPEEFLGAAHKLDNLSSMIRAERGLIRIIKRLPGRKIILTNSAYSYSNKVLRHLKLHRHFEKHVSIESMRVNGKLSPKPSRRLLRRLMASEKIHPSQAILVEDSDAALKSARTVGMKTVMVTRYTARDRYSGHATPTKKRKELKNRPAFADVKVQSVRQLPNYLNKLK